MHILHGQTAGLQAEVIVGAVDIAAAHPDMAAAVKIQTVTVVVPVVFNVQIGCPNEIAVQKCRCPRGSIQQPQVLYADIAAAQHPQQHGAVDTARVGEHGSIAVNDAAAANCDIFGILGKQKAAVQYFIIDVKGLNGGHSGGEIHKGLGNANKVLVRYLYLLGAQVDFTLCSISGGNLRNAIAREAHAVIGLSPNDKETARVLLNHYTADIENELKHVDPNVRISMESTEQPEKCISNAWKDKVIWALHACPHGVIGMSHDIEGLVETSTNLASVKMGPDDTIIVGTSQRSSIESCKNMIANQVASVFKLADAVVTHGDGYPGWAPNPDSKILKVAQETYKRLFNKDAKIMAIHAGLECGLFLEKYPNLDMISFGPTLRDVHSPNERIQIDTVGLWWSHLLELLKSIPAK